jgi:hypothetical protein
MQSQNIKFINLYIFVNIITYLLQDFIYSIGFLEKTKDLKEKMRKQNRTQSDFSPH